MSHPAARALLLLILANSLPWLVGRALRGRRAARLDLGLTLPDGRPLLGNHKTWRGLAAAACGCAGAAVLLGLHWWTGAEFAAISLSGDAFSSFCKRRLAVAPGTSVPLLDQLPEAALPLGTLRSSLGLDAMAIVAITGTFTLLDMLANAILRRSIESRAACGAPPPPGSADDLR